MNERASKYSNQGGEGASFYKGAPDLDKDNYPTQPSSPSTSSGGPIETFDGGNEGMNHSKTNPSWDSVDSPKNEAGSSIEGPWDVGYSDNMR